MLFLAASALAFEPRASVFRSQAVSASSPNMLLGLGKKPADSPVVATMTGAVVPTKTVVRAIPAGGFELVDAPAASTTSALTFNAFDTDTNTITELEVFKAQANWANAIKTISKVYLAGGDYIGAAGTAAGELYGYGHSNVLFKPTKAAEYQFRPTGEEAMSYFVGGSVVDNGYAEDAGFAINGGKGWADCVYDNHQVEIKGGIGIAMGNYYFTSAADQSQTKVEYTFGYTRCDDGKVRIFLHHSSVPYSA